MKTAQLKQLAVELMDSARLNLTRRGKLSHVLIISSATHERVGVLDHLEPRYWPIVAAQLEKDMRDWTVITHVSDSYYRHLESSQQIPASLAKDPKSEEAILVELKSATGELLCYVQPYSRNAEQCATFSRPAFWLEGKDSFSRVLRVKLRAGVTQ